MAKSDEADLKDGGRTVGRVLAVLELISGAKAPLRLVDIARGLDLPPSSAHALMQQLVKHGYVQQSAVSERRYEQGTALALLASKSISSLQLVRTARSIVHDLSVSIGENTFLAMRHARGMSYVDSVEDTYGLTMRFPLGTIRPLHASSSGKLFLALHVTPEGLDDFLGPEPLVAYTRHTITDKAKLRRVLDQVRADGIALNEQEVVDGACGVSAPIFDARERFVGSLTIGIPEVRFAARRQMAIENIRSSVAEISRRMGNDDWEGSLRLLQRDPQTASA